MSYDYEAKGREDFAAGRRDERLYATAEDHGASYRNGWQSARRAKLAADEGLAPPPAATEARAPEIQQPEAQNDGDLPAWIASSAASATPPDPEPARVEQKDAPPAEILPRKDAPEIGASVVKLAVGDERPKKPRKPAPPDDQLALFG